MSQTSRFTRARQLTSTVLPGRRLDDYADQVTGRLRRIAATRGTGMLPFSGRSDGSIYFRDGKVTFAESTRTPGPAPHDPPAPDQPPLNKIMAILAIAEPTIDAALELLSVQSRFAKFRPSKIPDTGPVSDISTEQVRTELQQIRTQVAGVRGSLVATSDGLVVAHDIPDVEPTQIAALAAATLAVARRATLATESGTFREAVARGSDGYLAVCAAGESAIVAVIGTSSLNVGMLQYRAREIIERIAANSSQPGALAAPVRPANGDSAKTSRSLPRRRSAASS